MRGDKRPCARLIRVAPGGGKGSCVLSDPDKERHQEKAEEERHFLVGFVRFVMDACAGIEDRRKCEQEQADINHKMMCKKIYINQDAQKDSQILARVTGEFEIENPPDPSDVTSHRRIHEPGKQGNAADAKKIFLRVDP